MRRLEVWSREVLAKGSKSFSFGAWFFSKDRRIGASLLYVWCRTSDDAVDQLESWSNTDERRARQLENILSLRRNTLSAYQPPVTGGMEFEAFAYLVENYRLPQHYPLELLEGLRMDTDLQTYETLEDLRLYCYRVAGVVGLMMSHIMGVSDERALASACRMGCAMQLTNIARDVLDDAKMGRCYLPKEWLRKRGVDPEKVGDSENRRAVFEVVKELLDHADHWYSEGRKGMKYLPLRSSWAIAIASRVYQQIGNVIRSRGEKAWDSRSYVRFPRKIREALRGTLDLLPQMATRFQKPWKEVPISEIWLFSSDLEKHSENTLDEPPTSQSSYRHTSLY